MLSAAARVMAPPPLTVTDPPMMPVVVLLPRPVNVVPLLTVTLDVLFRKPDRNSVPAPMVVPPV